MNALKISTIEEVDARAKDYATRRDTLAERVQALQDELEAVKRKRIGAIKTAAAEAAFAKSELETAILAHADLFVKPRTMTLHGIKVGLQKGKGEITCVNEQDAIARIEKLLPDQADVLIRVQKKLVKGALKNLDVATCKRLGLIVADTGDEVVIRATGTDVDKLVAKILEEGSAAEDAEDGR